MSAGRETATVDHTGAEWWADARRAPERWFRPLVEPAGWIALGSLLLGCLVSALVFTAILVALSAAAGLLVVGVGVPVMVWAFGLVEWFARQQRNRAGWLGETIEERPLRPHHGVGWRAFSTVVADRARWRQVAFFCTDLVVAPLFFVAAVVPLWLVIRPLVGFTGGLPDGPAGIALAVVALGVVPRWAIVVARLKTALDRWFLGPDRLASMTQRVTTLTTQRQAVLDAVAVERRRIERNLHDGVQQQLVATGIDIGLALQHIDDRPEDTRALLRQARERLQGSIGELRQLGRGLHPAVLGDRGIDAALSAVVANSPIPISVHVDPALELSVDVAETAYFVASEAVANILKHANARVASIHLVDVGRAVRVTVHDDGRGGADPTNGTGLAGLHARVMAMDGTFSLSSPPGGPTTLVVEVPNRG